jgi:hypothetical protein
MCGVALMPFGFLINNKGLPMPKPSLDPGTFESRYREQLKKHPGSIGIIAEGDSWFSFPKWLRTNLFLEIEAWTDTTAATWSLARNGDTVAEMMYGQQYETLRRIFSDATLPMDALLFSGGGNDLVAENLPNFLNTYRDGMQWMDCVNMPFLDLRFQEVMNAYNRLADLRDAYRPGIYIFTHAYDFAVPSGKGVRILMFVRGGWLQKQFLKKGVRSDDYQQEIITYILTRFAALMERIEKERSGFVYVRTQGILNKDTDWGDELHPTTAGFKKIAYVMKKALKQKFDVLPAASQNLAGPNL